MLFLPWHDVVSTCIEQKQYWNSTLTDTEASALMGDGEWAEHRASLSLRELSQEAFSSMLLLYHLIITWEEYVMLEVTPNKVLSYDKTMNKGEANYTISWCRALFPLPSLLHFFNTSMHIISLNYQGFTYLLADWLILPQSLLIWIFT